MKFNRVSAFAGVCCLFVPFAVGMAHAQSDPTLDQDKTFLMKASEGGMAEVQLGQLAAQKAQSSKVKAFGKKMVTDHTMLNNKLKPFADQLGVPPPTSLSPEDQAELDKLNGLSGADFDKEYVAHMEADHDKDLQAFKQEASTTQDHKLKMAVMQGEKVIEQHHQIIDRIGSQMGVAPASGM
jgi:putative membrane protein